MKKTKLTRSLMAAVSIVALSAVMYGCVHSGDDAPADPPPPVDTDGDGYADDNDAFPNDPNEWADANGNGVGDNADEAAALSAAQDAAMAAWEAARDALASIAGDGDENPVAYQRAMNALADAAAANTAAQAATTSADAGMYQANAEMARDTATAQVAMVVYSRDMEAIGAAREAASQSATHAMNSYMAAKNALAAVEDFKDLDMDSYDMAMAQVTAAMEAYNAAMAASNMAADAMLLADAQMYQTAAATAMGNAATANTNAMKYAGMVQTAEDNALAAARMAADDAYMAAKMAAEMARQAATDAAAEATAAEEANVASPAAIDSRTAANEADDYATMAETARDAAGTAKMAADDAMTSAAAKMHQADAEEEQGNAEGHRDTAQMKLAAAEASKIIAQNTGAGTRLLWQQRAMDANADAQGYATDARAAATKAREQARMARDNANHAMRARTNYVKADMQADAAEAAASAAEAAAMAAESALATAKEAYEMATADDATVAVAREQSNIARSAAMGAAGHPATANAQYMKAMEAAEGAERYAGMHVIGLLVHANGQDILVGTEDVTDDLPASVANARKARVTAIAGLMAGAADNTDNDNGSSGTTAMVTWNADVLDNPDTEDEDESMAVSLTMALNPGADGAVEFLRMDRADDPDTTGTDETHVKTATKLMPELSGFEHGYSVSDDGTHVIVFTDKEQATRRQDAKTVTIRNHPVSASRVKTNDDADGDPVALAGTVADLTTNTKYDHDGNPDTLPLVGTYACSSAAPTDCVIEVTGTQVTGVIGPVIFNSVPDADGDTDGAPDNGQGIITAVVPGDTNDDYVVFGVWLQEDGDGDATNALAPEFGAFAAGGDTAEPAATVVGTAKYSGMATGVYTAGTSVDYFQGRARLTADFDKVDDDEGSEDNDAGTVSGTIDQILAGGVSMSDVINLVKSGDIATGAFTGRARMGAAMIDESTEPATVSYAYTGDWTGRFYNPEKNADGIDDNTKIPGSVAGTFGVTGTDNMGTADDMTDDVIRSYVGAFGAHKDD